ncbi:hypothetical protein [Polynucleobacter acidiphobus]|uniref:hypothetical protein n=1 Tax=Polynucleobacter acidiphobus TaxID=556053 RepID=UPI000D3C5669|nr:hypothetical protein [Polynucleobacter acidiphobus]
MKIVTIISANYLAYAKTLALSVKKADHGALLVLIADKKASCKEKLEYISEFDYIFAEDIGIQSIHEMAFKYDITEFNTALKPFFLEYVINNINDRVVYLDPDVFVYERLTPIQDALQRSSILLTPHSTTPIMDGLRPSDIDFLRTGVFNLGFIAIKKCDEVKKFLCWWKSRCEKLCFNDTAFGTFVDQKWIDLVPCYFSKVEILKIAGLNVAYWNIHERTLSKNNGKFLVNGEPLYFFHYSGIDTKKPDDFSKHQSRTSLTSNSSLRELVASYIALLLENGIQIYQMIPYGFNYLNDGSYISPTARRALVVYGDTVLDPFDSKENFQLTLRRSGLQCDQFPDVGSVNTRNFYKYRKFAKYINMMIRASAFIFGAIRMFKLIRYFSIVSRESHYQSILLGQEMDFSHPKDRYFLGNNIDR